MFDSYKSEVQKIKNLITSYKGKRQELIDSEMYAEDFKQKKMAELRVKTFEQIADALDAMRESGKKDYAAAYKKATPANLEEARYWATVVHQDLSSMNPDQIIAAYKAVIKEGLPVKKGEFERVARNILSSKDEYHGKLYEFEVIRKENMTTAEKDQAKAIMAADSLEGTIARVQDFATFNINKLEEGEEITGRIDYLDSPFSELEKRIAKEFDGKTESLSDHRERVLDRNREIFFGSQG